MTLQELAAETLVEKNRRLRQAKCAHEEIFSSTVCGPHGTFENRGCLDCGKAWHMERAHGESARTAKEE